MGAQRPRSGWRAGYRCVHLVGRRWRGVSIGNGSGRRSPAGCPARTPPWCVGYRRRWGRGGSGRVAACHQPVWLRCRAATCRSPSEKRSPSSRPKAVACARSLAGSAVPRRPSRERYAATPRPVAACWSIGPRPRSGTPIGVPGAPRWPSSPSTTRYGSTCRTGLPAWSPRPTARRCPVPMFAGSGAVTGDARTGAGPGRGVRSRSPTGSGSTSPMMGPCGSRMRRSTRPCTSRAAARCAVS